MSNWNNDLNSKEYKIINILFNINFFNTSYYINSINLTHKNLKLDKLSSKYEYIFKITEFKENEVLDFDNSEIYEILNKNNKDITLILYKIKISDLDNDKQINYDRVKKMCILNWKKQSNINICKYHNFKNNYFCLSCEINICDLCNHDFDNCQLISLKEIKSDFDKLNFNFKTKEKEIINLLEKNEKDKEIFLEEGLKVKDSILEIFNNYLVKFNEFFNQEITKHNIYSDKKNIELNRLNKLISYKDNLNNFYNMKDFQDFIDNYDILNKESYNKKQNYHKLKDFYENITNLNKIDDIISSNLSFKTKTIKSKINNDLYKINKNQNDDKFLYTKKFLVQKNFKTKFSSVSRNNNEFNNKFGFLTERINFNNYNPEKQTIEQNLNNNESILETKEILINDENFSSYNSRISNNKSKVIIKKLNLDKLNLYTNDFNEAKISEIRDENIDKSKDFDNLLQYNYKSQQNNKSKFVTFQKIEEEKSNKSKNIKKSLKESIKSKNISLNESIKSKNISLKEPIKSKNISLKESIKSKNISLKEPIKINENNKSNFSLKYLSEDATTNYNYLKENFEIQKILIFFKNNFSEYKTIINNKVSRLLHLNLYPINNFRLFKIISIGNIMPFNFTEVNKKNICIIWEIENQLISICINQEKHYYFVSNLISKKKLVFPKFNNYIKYSNNLLNINDLIIIENYYFSFNTNLCNTDNMILNGCKKSKIINFEIYEFN